MNDIVMTHIIYEQPLSELIRVSLRLEALFERLDTLIESGIDTHTQSIMILIIDILNVLDRPDLKAKFGKEFNRLIDVLSKLQTNPSINQEKLKNTLQELKNLMQYFINSQGKIAQSLRDNEFLASIRQNLIKFGGCNTFDLPGYLYWFNQPAKTREKNIHDWIHAFDKIRTATTLLLNIVRNSSEPKEHIANKGFYHELLDTQLSCQMIRILLPKNLPLYPEISAGKHGMSIRFVTPGINERPLQTEQNIPFQLMKCTI